MTKTKRDQLPFDTVQQYLPGPIPNPIPETFREMGDPCSAGRDGMWPSG